jgi:thiol-disulfide isomerase/thioredoxin
MSISYKHFSIVIIYLLVLSSLPESTRGQASYPKINEKCPEFTFNKVQYFRNEDISLSDFKGKPFIIDFFSTGCSACFKSFSKINSILGRYKDQLGFLLVGLEDKHIRKIYERFRVQLNLAFPVTYASTIFDTWGIETVPHMIWVDKHGVVKAIITSEDFTEASIRVLIEGGQLNVGRKFSKSELKDNTLLQSRKKPLLMDRNGGSDTNFIYRDILANWEVQPDRNMHPEFLASHLKGKIQALGVPLSTLFMLAYGDTVMYRMPRNKFEADIPNSYGRWWLNPIIALKDSGFFEYNRRTGINLFTYSLIVPENKGSGAFFQRILQQDLRTNFNLEAKVEIRKMPCWVLVANDQSRNSLKTKGRTPVLEYKDQYLGIRLVNQPLSALIFELWANNQGGLPFIDATGINDRVDLDLETIFSDLESVKRELAKHGLNLIESEREMKVIIVSECNLF